MTPIDFILGYTLPILPVSIAQSIICYIVALLLGLEPTLNILLALIFIIPISILFIALGLLISALTENQMVSAVGTLTASALLLGASFANPYINFAPLRTVLSWISVYTRFANFNKGYFDIAALIYYASFAFVCMFVTVRIYEKRRWA